MTRTEMAMAACAALLASALPAVGEDAAAQPRTTGGYRGPDRNGVFPTEGLLRKWPEGGPRLLWRVGNIGAGFGAPCVTREAVYVTGSKDRPVGKTNGADGGKRKRKHRGQGTLFAFDHDGKLNWSVACGTERSGSFRGPRATPTVSDGCVYIAGGLGNVYCYDIASHELAWKRNVWADLGDGGGKRRMGWGYNETPLIVGDLLVVNSCSTSETGPPVVAVDKRTGEVAWKADPGAGNLSAGDGSTIAVARDGRTLIVAHTYRAVLGLEAETGRTLWTLQTRRGAGMTPVHAGGFLLLGHKRGVRLMELSDDGAKVEQVWAVQHAAPENPPRVTTPEILGYEPPVILDGLILLAKYRHTDITQTWLGAMRLSDGKELWSRPSQKKGWPPKPPTFAVAEGLLYVLEGGPRCSLIRPTAKGPQELGSFRPAIDGGPTYTHPVIFDGRLYLRNNDTLAVYEIRIPGGEAP